MEKKSAEGDQAPEYDERLAAFFSSAEVPDYRGLIGSAEGDISLAEAYRMASVENALARGLIVHAFDLVLPLPVTIGQVARAQGLLLHIIEVIGLKATPAGRFVVEGERLQEAVHVLIRALANDPLNHSLRIKLASILQPSVFGMTGLALMASLVLRLYSRPIELEQPPSTKSVGAAWLMTHEHFVKAAFDWLKGEQPIVLGKTVMPKAILTESADDVAWSIVDYLMKTPHDSKGDLQGLLNWLALAMVVIPHSSDPDLDLPTMRLVAERLAGAGRLQEARDLIENALSICGDTARRRRLGWFGMADIYHRCHNHLESLIAMSAALVADNVMDEVQLWNEATGIARLLRDCGLIDQALLIVARAKEFFRHRRILVSYRHRLETLEIQIRQLKLSGSGHDSGMLESLLSDTVQNGQAVLANNDATEPVAALLGQLLRLARQTGVPIPSHAGEILSQLTSRVGKGAGVFVDAMSVEAPSSRDLLTLVTASSSARYSKDVGYDIRNITMMAKRALSVDQYISTPIDASFALELLSDRGVATPNWKGVAEPPPALGKIAEPAEIAQDLSRNGISVLQAGFDSGGRLVRVSSIGGRLEAAVREGAEVILEERFRKWSEQYPYRYGVDETTPNLFYTTTEDLRLSQVPAGPVVVVADVAFQPFPPNLLFIDEDFAGRTRPMASAPSLAWLEAARKIGNIGDGRRCGWVSTASGSSEHQTLPMVAQRLQSTFDQYGFLFDTGPTLPANFAGASLAVVTAHGGVHPDGQYFQVVADEGKLLVAGGDLANALRNIGVVILFVCSGGRSDKHPSANTNLGLAKQVLDRGCTAVVASPWPLDARVPSYWLPEFLKHWCSNCTLIEANFLANKMVDRSFAMDPARGLAMTVFGNPELRQG